MQNLELKEALTKVRARIALGFCHGRFAVDKQDRSADVKSEEACKWCLQGAVWREVPFIEADLHPLQGNVLTYLNDKIGALETTSSIVLFNDTHTQEEVLAFLDGLIKELS